jgi:hypothetical protein
MKTFSVILAGILAGCGSAAISPNHGVLPSDLENGVPTPGPGPIQQISQDSNSVVQNQNTIDSNTVQNPNQDPNDTNPDHLQINPVTGKYDYRYGTWSVGPKPRFPEDDPANPSPCRAIHGAALSFPDMKVAGSPVTLSKLGGVSWVWSNGNVESWNADGDGSFTFVDSQVTCLLYIRP